MNRKERCSATTRRVPAELPTTGWTRTRGHVASRSRGLLQGQTWLILLVSAVGACRVGAAETAAASPAKDVARSVRVDFDRVQGPATHRASGFLSSISVTSPPPEMVRPLKPRTFRLTMKRVGNLSTPMALYDRLHNRLDAEIHVILDGAFRARIRPKCVGDDGDWKPWEVFVEQAVTESKQKGYRFHWDIWNEPNVDNWGKYPDQLPDGEKTKRFFEAWKRAWRKIKAVDPDAVIVGPSNSSYRLGKKYRLFTVEEFLLFAQREQVLPDVLSWHEFYETRLVSDVARARAFLKKQEIDIRKISIGEYGGRSQHTLAGTFVHYFANLERASVDSAIRACSVDQNDKSTCSFASLDGLLTNPELKPRSTWWVYKAYADIEGNLVSVTGSDQIKGIAGHSPKSAHAGVLLGRKVGKKEKSASRETVEVELTGLKELAYLKNAAGKARLLVRRIPHSGWDALPRHDTISDAPVDFRDKLHVTLPAFGPHDAYRIDLYNGDRKK